jgi:DNA-binding MarR family transcriptional regulator
MSPLCKPGGSDDHDFNVLRTIAEAGQAGARSQQEAGARSQQEAGARSQQEIAERLSLTKGTVSRHVTNAMQRGWLTVEPSPVSRREHAVVLTPAGRSLLDQGLALQAEREGLANLTLSPDDVAATIRVLTAMCQLLEKEEK